MRRRLTIAVLGTVVVSLLLAGIVTLALVRWADRQATQRSLEQEASVLAGLMETVPFDEVRPHPRLVIAAQRLNRKDVGVVVIKDMSVFGKFPEQVQAKDLNLLVVGAKETVSGVRGSTAWAAAVGTRPGPLSTAVVLTDDADQFLGTVLRWLGVSAAVSLVLGAVVATVLSRRITEPMRQARDATRLIAGGDLSVRVPVDQHHSDEVSDLSSSINDMAESLERSQSLERQFLMSISHDLRTPLTSIRGYGEAIADGTAEDWEQAADVIVSESVRLERLVSDLLDLARLDARAFTLDRRLVDVEAVIREVCAGFAPRAAERDVELLVGGLAEAVGLTPEPVTAWCDLGRLAQVISNLVQNGLKFADSEVRVECRTDHADGTAWAVVTVSDDGPGISEVDRPHLFERLYVARHTPRPEESGSGLGLAIVAELTEAMGGTVSVDPRSPTGTRFTVKLRATNPDHAD